MNNLTKKLEEQIAFAQREILQMSDELYSQQKEIIKLKKEISILVKRIDEIQNSSETNLIMEDKKPPHY
jgi:uncharacterized coiled-coil protein SlyX